MTVYQKSRRVKRTYRSPRRAAQAQATRTSIVEAAGRLFVEAGYAQSSIREIAETAGVAEPTVYATLGDKASIAKAVADAMVEQVGKDELTALEERLRAEPSLERRARIAARANREAFRSDALRLRDALIAGATSDPRLAEIVEDFTQGGRELTGRLVDLLVAPTGIEPAAREHATDVLWALSSSSIYRRLVEWCGWSDQAYEDWLAAETARVLHAAGSGSASPS